MKIAVVRFWAVAASAAVIGGCGDDEGTVKQSENKDMAGDEDPCGNMTYASVGWEETLNIGGTAAAVFGEAEGSCSAAFVWDASGAGAEVSPMTGESEVTVTLTLDRTSAELGFLENPDEAAECGMQYLRIGGTVAIETADGAFKDTGEVLLYYSSESETVGTIRLSKEFAALEGDFQVDLDESADQSGGIYYKLTAPGVACAGAVGIILNESEGDGTASSSMGEIGNWSNTGCEVGQTPVDLTQEDDDGVTVLAALEEIWGLNTFDAQWDNESSTELSVKVDFSNDPAGCTDGPVTYVTPVTVTYSTADEVLGERSVNGDLIVSLNADNSIRTSSLGISDRRKCASKDDSLDYGFGECADLTGITVQLGLDWSGDGEWHISDGGLMVYEYDIDSSAPPSAADRVRTLSFK